MARKPVPEPVAIHRPEFTFFANGQQRLNTGILRLPTGRPAKRLAKLTALVQTGHRPP